MTVYYRDLMDIFMQRADRIGLVDEATGKADATELELYLFQALLNIVELYDLSDYTRRDSLLLTTEVGTSNYPLPEQFGRLIAPRVRNRRGIYLASGGQDFDLEFVDPNVFVRQEIRLNQRPEQFTVMHRELLLGPAPDTSEYRVHGIYIEQVVRPQLDDPVPLQYPTVLVDEAIFMLAGDIGKISEAIVARRTEAFAKLAGSPVAIADSTVRGPAGRARN